MPIRIIVTVLCDKKLLMINDSYCVNYYLCSFFQLAEERLTRGHNGRKSNDSEKLRHLSMMQLIGGGYRLLNISEFWMA